MIFFLENCLSAAFGPWSQGAYIQRYFHVGCMYIRNSHVWARHFREPARSRVTFGREIEWNLLRKIVLICFDIVCRWKVFFPWEIIRFGAFYLDSSTYCLPRRGIFTVEYAAKSKKYARFLIFRSVFARSDLNDSRNFRKGAAKVESTGCFTRVRSCRTEW